MTLQAKALPYVVLLGFMYGSSLLVSRFSLSQFDASSYVSARLLLSSVLFLLIFIFSPKYKFPKDRKLWKQASILGIAGTAIPISFINLSMLYQSSGITALLLTLGPAFTVILASFLLEDEPLSKRKVFGVSVALSGALILILLGETGLPDVSEVNPRGYLFVFIAMLGVSFATVYTRKNMRDQKSIEATGIQMFVAALVVIPLTFIFVGFDFSRVKPMGYAALGYATVVGTFLGMLLSFYNAKKFGATTSAMTAYIVTIVGGFGGVLFLGEKFTWGMVAGMILIISGILVINKKDKEPEKLI